MFGTKYAYFYSKSNVSSIIFFLMYTQIICVSENYFSGRNIVKDYYLRNHMDARGFIFVSEIMKFHDIARMNVSYYMVIKKYIDVLLLTKSYVNRLFKQFLVQPN